MTVVAALVGADGSVAMAADRQQTMSEGTVCWPSPSKLQRHAVQVRGAGAGRRDVLLATCGSASMAQLARYRLAWPQLPQPPVARAGRGRGAAEDLLARRVRELDLWAFEVAVALTELASSASSKSTKSDADDTPVATLDGGLLAFEGRVWGLGPYQALPMSRGYEAIGSGGETATGALGALAALGRLGDPVAAVTLAVRVAIDQDAHCGGQVDVEELDAPKRL